MIGFFRKLLDTSDFPPRWHCGIWSSGHGWTHIISDVAIAGAYAAIPLILVYFLRRRRDIPFVPIFWLFALFVLSCGVGHFIEATIFWHPWYRLSALAKVCTATVSWVTVLVLIPTLPKALALPGLAVANQRLEREIRDRTLIERQLRESLDRLQTITEAVVNREERMMELKSEINSLLRELGRDERYRTSNPGMDS